MKDKELVAGVVFTVSFKSKSGSSCNTCKGLQNGLFIVMGVNDTHVVAKSLLDNNKRVTGDLDKSTVHVIHKDVYSIHPLEKIVLTVSDELKAVLPKNTPTSY